MFILPVVRLNSAKPKVGLYHHILIIAYSCSGTPDFDSSESSYIQAKKNNVHNNKTAIWNAPSCTKKSACSLAYRPASLYVHIASSALLTLPAMQRATAILAFRRFLVSPGCYPDVRNSYNRKHLHLADTCRSCLHHIGRHRSHTRIPLPQPFLCRATSHHNSSRKA